MTCTGSTENIEIVAVILWSILLNRNNLVRNAHHKYANMIFQSTMDTYRHWKSANQHVATPTSCHRQIIMHS